MDGCYTRAEFRDALRLPARRPATLRNALEDVIQEAQITNVTVPGQPCGSGRGPRPAVAVDDGAGSVSAAVAGRLGSWASALVGAGAGPGAAAATRRASRRGVMRRFVKDFLLPMAVAVALAFVIQAAVAKPYEIPTESMVPTIQANDRIIANRLIYRFRDIERGDIIVFDPPPSATRTCGDAGGGNIPFVKRVIGLPGDKVEVRADGTTLVNGKPLSWSRRPCSPPQLARSDAAPGGARPTASSCSATTGPGRATRTSGCPTRSCPRSNVIGQAEIIYWPLSHLGFLD